MTQRLLQLAARDWVEIDGEAALRESDLLQLPFDRFLNAIYHWETRDRPPEAVRKFEIMLWVPPPDVAPTVGPWSPEAETSAFKAVRAALGMKDAPPAS